MERYFNFIKKYDLNLDDFKACIEDAYNYHDQHDTFEDYMNDETLKTVSKGKIICNMEGDEDDLYVDLVLQKPNSIVIDSASEKLNIEKIRKFLKKKETKVYLSNLQGRVRRDLTHVVELIIEDCEDLILPSLPSCVRLDCVGNGIKKLPKLPKCEYLDCSANELTELPDLPVCEDVNCNSNKLEKLPDLPACTTLHCSDNKLKKLPDLQLCENLDCSDNELKKLPDLPVCRSLDCNNNQLKKLPNLPECIHLICYNNYITELPYMPKVKSIYCENNQLKSIPNQISEDLETLQMSKQPVYFDCDAILNNHPNLTDLDCDVAKKMKPMFSSIFSSRPARNYSENSAVLEDISFRNKDFGSLMKKMTSKRY